MKKYTFVTLAASALAALSIGLATPAVAGPPTGPNDDTVGTTQNDGNVWAGWSHAGQTPYGTYQNDNKRFSGARR